MADDRSRNRVAAFFLTPFMQALFGIVDIPVKKDAVVGKYRICPIVEQAHLGTTR